MSEHFLRVFTAMTILTIPITGPAYAVELETGEWQVTMQSRNPVTGEPISETSIECIESDKFDPSQELSGDMSCSVTEKQESENSVSWKIECGGGDMPAFHGEGIFVSQGDSAEGEMKMTMTMGTSTMEMRTEWNGKKISSRCAGK